MRKNCFSVTLHVQEGDGPEQKKPPAQFSREH